ncbi:MAG: M50 family metallopeptidase [Peptostreptococcaceae bacterium]|nr:M50 family metallopeptidase [Peptostreptococcaceae bacterium]
MKIIVAILVFSFLMLIHELGHFLMAKKLGIRAYELSIGMGPKLFGKTVKDTQYNIRLIPFGAFVRFGDDEDEMFTEPDNFMNKSPLDRIKVIIMGPLVNIIAALLLMIGVAYHAGFPTNTIAAVSEGLPAAKAGIEAGDQVIEVNGKKTTEWTHIVAELSVVPEDKKVHLLVQKADGDQMDLEMLMEEHEGRFMVGISPKFEKDLFRAIKYGSIATARQSTMMVDTLKQLFIGRANIEEFSGPVGIVAVVGEATKAGFETVIILTALLSLNLGIINLVPIPGLDGSKILFYIYELLSKKQLNRELEMRLTMAGFFLIIAFSIFITYKDIVRLFFSKG